MRINMSFNNVYNLRWMSMSRCKRLELRMHIWWLVDAGEDE
jgi:hypothetical protein